MHGASNNKLFNDLYTAYDVQKTFFTLLFKNFLLTMLLTSGGY